MQYNHLKDLDNKLNTKKLIGIRVISTSIFPDVLGILEYDEPNRIYNIAFPTLYDEFKEAIKNSKLKHPTKVNERMSHNYGYSLRWLDYMKFFEYKNKHKLNNCSVLTTPSATINSIILLTNDLEMSAYKFLFPNTLNLSDVNYSTYDSIYSVISKNHIDSATSMESMVLA